MLVVQGIELAGDIGGDVASRDNFLADRFQQGQRIFLPPRQRANGVLLFVGREDGVPLQNFVRRGWIGIRAEAAQRLSSHGRIIQEPVENTRQAVRVFLNQGLERSHTLGCRSRTSDGGSAEVGHCLGISKGKSQDDNMFPKRRIRAFREPCIDALPARGHRQTLAAADALANTLEEVELSLFVTVRQDARQWTRSLSPGYERIGNAACSEAADERKLG